MGFKNTKLKNVTKPIDFKKNNKKFEESFEKTVCMLIKKSFLRL
jgi:hypothetical protein